MSNVRLLETILMEQSKLLERVEGKRVKSLIFRIQQQKIIKHNMTRCKLTEIESLKN